MWREVGTGVEEEAVHPFVQRAGVFVGCATVARRHDDSPRTRGSGRSFAAQARFRKHSAE